VGEEDLVDADWGAVADAIRHRLTELGMTMTDLAAQSRVSLFTVRELVHNTAPRRRQPRTLRALSEALAWPSSYLSELLTGQDPQPYEDESSDPVLQALAEIRHTLESIDQRVSAIEARQAEQDATP
jgi:hypothetical protein